jgi:hypothetical protein
MSPSTSAGALHDRALSATSTIQEVPERLHTDPAHNAKGMVAAAGADPLVSGEVAYHGYPIGAVGEVVSGSIRCLVQIEFLPSRHMHLLMLL